MKRIYTEIVNHHFERFDQMLFLSGPRQAGKTTISKSTPSNNTTYLNWDIDEDRIKILQGVKSFNVLQQKTLGADRPLIIFDEIHKYDQWKTYLKGFIDLYKSQAHTIVTGSSKLDIYKKGGDSLMGRYFLYRVHPLSIAECIRTTLPSTEIQAPAPMPQEQFEQLMTYGGYPEPFLQKDQQFLIQWRRLKRQQLFAEDIRELIQIQELPKIELLAEYLKINASQQTVMSNLASKVKVSASTIDRWIGVLEQFYYCFKLRPWSNNVRRSLLKEPKIYLWNWAEITNEGSRFENFVAQHLLKATQLWTDLGFGEYELYYLRDKDKNEVDFCVTKNNTPWFLVEAKLSKSQGISKSLQYFQKQTGAEHAFQVVRDMPYINEDCFSHYDPIIVPALTLFSQLL